MYISNQVIFLLWFSYNVLCNVYCSSFVEFMHRLPEKLVLETQKLSNWYAWISAKRNENHPRYRSFPPIVCCILYNRQYKTRHVQGPLWSWSYGSWIYNYLCNQCIALLTLWVRISLMASCTRYNIITFFSDLSQVDGLSGHSGFLHQQNLPQRYNWNIVESGVKHHSTN